MVIVVLVGVACIAVLLLSPGGRFGFGPPPPPPFPIDGDEAGHDIANSKHSKSLESEWLRKDADWQKERQILVQLLEECTAKRRDLEAAPAPPTKPIECAKPVECKPVQLVDCNACNAARLKTEEEKRADHRSRTTAFTSAPAAGHPITPVVAELHRQYFEASLTREHAAAVQRRAAEDAPLASVSCTWQFSHYTSSAWETEWYNQVDALQSGPQPSGGAICAKLSQEQELERGTYLVTRVVELSQQANRAASNRVNATRGPPYESFDGGDSATKPTPTRGRRLLAAVASATTATTTGAPQTLRLGTREHMRDVADQLFSRMNYKLVCTPGGARDSTTAKNAADAAPRDSFVAARGFDFIEPLIGILRDPLTICPRVTNELLIPAHIRDLYHSAPNEIQSKDFLLSQIATPFHVDVRGEEATDGKVKDKDADGVLPSWVTPAVLRRVNVAIDTIATGSGASPWMHRVSHIAFDAPSNVPNSNTSDVKYAFLSSGLQDSYSTRLVVPENDLSSEAAVTQLLDQTSDGVGTLLVSERSDEEEQTAIVIDADGEVSLPGALSIAAPFWNPTNSRRHPASGAPRVILFDLGASLFSGWDVERTALGSAWFYQQLALRGQRIDQVYAWEYVVLDPVVEWKQIPPELYPHMSFINTGVTADPRQTDNPWNTLLSIARPIDYVIVKLDIDSDWIETPLMQQLLATPKLQRLVDEMYFEHHVKLHEMNPLWAARTGSITLSYQWYTTLRQAGIRMHSWP